MTHRVVISNERLNSYGYWVKTHGVELEQYKRNPVLLYMHERGHVIGIMKDVRVEGDAITGELHFDEATELSCQCKAQWEAGSLRMVSAGLVVLESSDDQRLKKDGQTRPTLTRTKLVEVSLVDIGANDDAMRLQQNSEYSEYSDQAPAWTEMPAGCYLAAPKLEFDNNPKTQPNEMDIKTLALMVGLPETATEEEVTQKIDTLKEASKELSELQAKYDNLNKAQIESLVDNAIGERRLMAENKAHFVALGQKLGAAELKATLDAIAPQVSLAELLVPGEGKSQWTKLSEVSEGQLAQLREENPEEYKRLYKAEYGMVCEI